jgi:HlyD family secretion protein
MTRKTRGAIRVTTSLCLVAAALSVAGCGAKTAAYPQVASKDGAVPVETVSVGREDLKRVSEATPAELMPYEQVDLYAKISGYVRKMHVDAGDRVRGPRYDARGKLVEEGQILAELYAPEMDEELKEKEALADQARSEVELAQKAHEAAVAAYETAVAMVEVEKAGRQRADALVKRWQSEFDRMKAVAKGTIDRQTLDETEYQLEAARATRAELEMKIRSAEALRAEAAAKRDKTEAEIKAAKARQRVAEAARDRMKALLQYTRIPAPFDGVVTKRNVHTGAFLDGKSDKLLLTVVRTDRLRVWVDVPETDVRYLDVPHPEQHVVQATLKALPGKTFAWKITRFAPVLGEGKKVRAEVEIDNPYPDPDDPKNQLYLYAGGYGYAAVVLQEKTGALTLPATCLVAESAGASVWLVVDGKAKKQRVTVGLNDGKKAEISSGLTGAEEVVASGLAGLRDGQAVVARKK